VLCAQSKYFSKFACGKQMPRCRALVLQEHSKPNNLKNSSHRLIRVAADIILLHGYNPALSKMHSWFASLRRVCGLCLSNSHRHSVTSHTEMKPSSDEVTRDSNEAGDTFSRRVLSQDLQRAEASTVSHSVEGRSKPQEHEGAGILSEPVEVSAVPQVVETCITPGHEEARMLSEREVSAVLHEEARTLSEPVEVSTVPQPVGEYTVSQLFREFDAHLVAELSDGACRGRVEERIRQVCNITNQSVVREALQAVASTFASYICDHFAEEMTQKSAAVQKAPWRAQLPSRSLQSVNEYTEFLSEFVQQNLRRFYDPYDETVRDIARQAARNASRKVDVPHELMPGLAKLALYDFIIFCGT
jgi:hypothetical protein